MNRRNFFARMTQGVAAAVLATHLSFGNLVPIPASQNFKWVKMIFTYVQHAGHPLGSAWGIDVKSEPETDPITVATCEQYDQFGKTYVEKFKDRHVEYFKVEEDGQLPEQEVYNSATYMLDAQVRGFPVWRTAK